MTDDYLPPAHGVGDWETVDPRVVGFDPRRLAEAVAFVETARTPWPVDIRAHIEAGYFEPAPDNEILGPTAPRGEPNGLILRRGRIAARWGDTRRVDMTFSAAKSYLSLLAGIAMADGLICDLDERVGATVHDGGFEGPHNGRITWRQLLQQTSEWGGTLWGKPDTIDRNRIVTHDGKSSAKGQPRPLAAPGAFWEYNDVRVNRFSLALLRRFGRALPRVFAERIATPIGASCDWHWEGYRNSLVEIGPRLVQSVPGGGHWGGGMFIHAEDQARIGLLMLRRGRWGERTILQPAWLRQSLAPADLNPNYGFMWWLNTGRLRFASASPESFFALGTGGNISWIDPANDLVVVTRWLDTDMADGFMAKVVAALSDERTANPSHLSRGAERRR